jgi:hypothetical protein
LTLADRAAADLRLIAEYWPGLAETRIPGTPPPYRVNPLTADQRAQLDHQARQERVDRDGLAPGEHPDAVRPEVLDLLASLLIDAVDLAEHVSLAARAPVLPPPPTAFADPTPYLTRAADYLPEAVAAWTNGPDLAAWVARTARHMLNEMGRALALVYDGQQLRMICPWCAGRTETAPIGGEYTWRVRDLLGTLRCEHGHPDRQACPSCPQHIAIVCESGTCEPPSRDVTTWWRGHPAWPIYEWDWLAKRVHAAV